MSGDYFSPKFGSDPAVALLYAATLDNGTSTGDAEAPVGWFDRIDVTDPDDARALIDHVRDFDYSPDAAALADPDSLVGWWIIGGDSQGFVYAQRFDTEADRDDEYSRMDDEYGAWLGDDDDDGVIA
jgi:hypothetical protein